MRKRRTLLSLSSLLALIWAAPASADTQPSCTQYPNFACVAGEASYAGTHDFSSATLNVPADTIDALTEIAAALKSGADATLITGTEGTNGNCAEWNVDGDLIGSGAPCGGTTAWNAIGDATVGADIGMATYAQTMTWGVIPAATTGLLLQDGASVAATLPLFAVATGGTSTALPVRFTAQGTANGVQMSTAGLLSAIGTGGIQASALVCTDCVDASDIGANQVSASEISDTGFLIWEETAGGTWPNKTLANSPRSASTALIINNGVVLRRVGSCGGINEYTLSGTTLTMCDATDQGTVLAYYEQ
jgi:hypothetical protein